jgi:nucleotide sugar dehydrogenase
VICLGQDIHKNKIISKNIINCLKDIGKRIYKNNLIIIRGTTQIGFCRKIAKEILEKQSGLKCGKDFYLSHMSERIIEGNALNELNNLPQLVSGYSKNCLAESLKFSNLFFKNSVELKSLEESEMIKLVSNSYRDLNFAFSNEVARISNILKFSGEGLIQKANLGYPRNNIAKPSLGVGGYCLPKDTFLFEKNLINKSAGYRFGKTSRESNKNITSFFAHKVKTFFKGNKNYKALIFGIAFKGFPETVDTRNSPSIFFSEILEKNNFRCDFFDIKGDEIFKITQNKKIIKKLKKITKYDLIVFTNNNHKYEEHFLKNIKKNLTGKEKYIFDTSSIINKSVAKSYNYKYLQI